jgi:hypothetical protein
MQTVYVNKTATKLIKGEDIVKYIKVQRIKCWGDLKRMEDKKLVKIPYFKN